MFLNINKLGKEFLNISTNYIGIKELWLQLIREFDILFVINIRNKIIRLVDSLQARHVWA